MATYWTSDWTDEQFDDYGTAWEDCRKRCNLDVFADHFHDYISYASLLDWVMKQDAFWYDSKMQEYYNKANSDCFKDHYFEHEMEDEE